MSKKVFKKKVSKKQMNFTFLLFIENHPFRRFYELSLYLSTSEEIESEINVEIMTIANM
jgi:hypothetical protein